MSHFRNNKLTVRTCKNSLRLGFWTREVGYGLEDRELKLERSMLFDDRFEVVFSDYNEDGSKGKEYFARTMNTAPSRTVTLHRCNRGELSWLDI